MSTATKVDHLEEARKLSFQDGHAATSHALIALVERLDWIAASIERLADRER